MGLHRLVFGKFWRHQFSCTVRRLRYSVKLFSVSPTPLWVWDDYSFVRILLFFFDGIVTLCQRPECLSDFGCLSFVHLGCLYCCDFCLLKFDSTGCETTYILFFAGVRTAPLWCETIATTLSGFIDLVAAVAIYSFDSFNSASLLWTTVPPNNSFWN